MSYFNLSDIEDKALNGYLPALLSSDDDNNSPFLTYYDFLENKTTIIHTFTRKEFLLLVLKCIALLHQHNTLPGMRQAHFFSGNKVEDLVLRTASIFVGSVPVTINWQADTISTIKYKISATDCKLVFYDDRTPQASIEEIKNSFSSTIQFIKIQEIHITKPIENLTEYINRNVRNLPTLDDTRCIIFTSG
jgi:long-subunit acyl-CoA synthetase (AMP-forming)